MKMTSEPSVYVSFTTIKARIKNTEGVIKSLLNQNVLPAKIVLSISSDPFMLDDGCCYDDLPEYVKEKEQDGMVEVLNVENIGPYRKLLPVLENYKHDEKIIVTVDDDIRYPIGFLETIVDTLKDNNSVAAFRARYLGVKDDGFLPYKNWGVVLEDGEIGPSHNIMPTGRDGVAYKNSFFPDLIMLEELRKLAPVQDDLVWKIACLVQGVKSIRADRGKTKQPNGQYFHNVNQHGEEVALYKTNVKGENDIALGKLYAWLEHNYPDVINYI